MQARTIYHVWFATKHRKWLLQGDIDSAARRFIRDIAREKHIDLLECASAVDHVHLLLRLKEDQKLTEVMNLLRGGSSYRLHRACPELKLDSGADHFWQRGYSFAVVEPGSLTARRRYVRTQTDRLDKFER
jgi:REP element-mobilizing transposase RayT